MESNEKKIKMRMVWDKQKSHSGSHPSEVMGWIRSQTKFKNTLPKMSRQEAWDE